RLELLLAGPATAPHGGGVLVIDDSGDRKDGAKTAHVGRQWLGRYGKTGNGVVTVTTVRADERLYYPVHAVPYTPARHFAKGKGDPGFRTKLAIGADLAVRAREAGFTFRAVVADSAYGDQDGFRGELAQAGLPFVMALRPHRGTWARAADAHTPVEAARALAEIVRSYGMRHWVEQSYKQVKDELGWADFQVRSDIAIRRHQVLVNCAFSFCWLAGPPPPGPAPASPQERGHHHQAPAAPGVPDHPSGTKLASYAARRPQLADPRDRARALVAGLVQSAPAR